jgi:hypothetical protein
MSKIPARRDAVAYKAFQFCDFREPVPGGPGPDGLVARANLEDPAPSRDQGDLPDVIRKSGQELLRHPGGPKQPAALVAVLNLDTRVSRSHHIENVIPDSVVRCRNNRVGRPQQASAGRRPVYLNSSTYRLATGLLIIPAE